MANRLSRRITIVSSQLKSLIKEHNTKATGHDKLTWETATELNALSTASGIYQSHPTIPDSVKKEACDAQILLERAEEEISMLKEEMNNTFAYYIKENEDLSCAIQSVAAETQFQRGTLALLHMARFNCEKHLSRLNSAFNTIDLQQLPEPNYCHIPTSALTVQQISTICSIRQVDPDRCEEVMRLGDHEEEEEECAEDEEEAMLSESSEDIPLPQVPMQHGASTAVSSISPCSNAAKSTDDIMSCAHQFAQVHTSTIVSSPPPSIPPPPSPSLPPPPSPSLLPPPSPSLPPPPSPSLPQPPSPSLPPSTPLSFASRSMDNIQSQFYASYGLTPLHETVC